jgi:hypothetical protein
MLLLLDIYGLKCATNYILLFIVMNPNIRYIVLFVMNDYVYIHRIITYTGSMDCK